ncbi:hypothetical protein L228DRAFT_269647 [Xylona heveae TC161]|uniref:Uncharacterized protein n=1 Tax=Xylona heveae (strain CBS 132557 / TC161) TaxID=1328760 RepID=A0A165FQK7_XYLHT|nr:hypothetical protein L228DRAFT_269647 [Xylona heveae TC161]KZF21259.1 hypothetical protein L228DRAFT_269647 [Xylona heveae TC161]
MSSTLASSTAGPSPASLRSLQLASPEESNGRWPSSQAVKFIRRTSGNSVNSTQYSLDSDSSPHPLRQSVSVDELESTAGLRREGNKPFGNLPSTSERAEEQFSAPPPTDYFAQNEWTPSHAPESQGSSRKRSSATVTLANAAKGRVANGRDSPAPLHGRTNSDDRGNHTALAHVPSPVLPPSGSAEALGRLFRGAQLPSNGRHISSGFSFPAYLGSAYGISRADWALFTSEIRSFNRCTKWDIAFVLSAASMTLGNSAAAVILTALLPALGISLIGGTVVTGGLGLLALLPLAVIPAAVVGDIVRRSAKRRNLKTAREYGAIERVLKEWNDVYFHPKGLSVKIELPKEDVHGMKDMDLLTRKWTKHVRESRILPRLGLGQNFGRAPAVKESTEGSGEQDNGDSNEPSDSLMASTPKQQKETLPLPRQNPAADRTSDVSSNSHDGAPKEAESNAPQSSATDDSTPSRAKSVSNSDTPQAEQKALPRETTPASSLAVDGNASINAVDDAHPSIVPSVSPPLGAHVDAHEDALDQDNTTPRQGHQESPIREKPKAKAKPRNPTKSKSGGKRVLFFRHGFFPKQQRRPSSISSTSFSSSAARHQHSSSTRPFGLRPTGISDNAGSEAASMSASSSSSSRAPAPDLTWSERWRALQARRAARHADKDKRHALRRGRIVLIPIGTPEPAMGAIPQGAIQRDVLRRRKLVRVIGKSRKRGRGKRVSRV